MQNITKEECTSLTLELQDIIMRVFDNDGSTIIRYHTEQELQRLDEISEILKNCSIVD